MTQFKLPSVGQKVIITPQNNLYKGSYEVAVLALEKSYLSLAMPYDQGKLVLLNTGSSIHVSFPSSELHFVGELVSRGFNPSPTLVVRIPYSITHTFKESRPLVITVTSGKGGVGKTSTVINLAITLAKHNKRVFIIDADLGTANVDVLLNIQAKYNLNHIISREKDLREILVEGPGGIYVIPGGSGLQNLANMSDTEFSRIIDSLQTLEDLADIIIIDTGAGLSKNVINFVMAADECILITTPEPHSITDAYAIIKVLDDQAPKIFPKLVINRAESASEGQAIGNRITSAVNRFLSIKITYFGYILDDPAVGKAIRRLSPYVLENPQAPASKCLETLAQKLLEPALEISEIKKTSSFFSKFKELFSR